MKVYGKRTDYPIEKLGESTYRINEFDGANCYLIVGKTEALLIDTGVGVGDLKGAVRKITDLPVTVVATHAHVDHLGGYSQFERVFVHNADICRFNRWQTGVFVRKFFVLTQSQMPKYGVKLSDVKRNGCKTEWVGIEDGHRFDLGDRVITVKHIPGHTEGSIALIDDKAKNVFVGDNCCPMLWLFLPHHTSVEDWLPSGQWIRGLFDEYKVYWGHMSGKLTKETADYSVSLAQTLLKRKNSLFSIIKVYPKFDQNSGYIVYTSGTIHNKKRKT